MRFWPILCAWRSLGFPRGDYFAESFPLLSHRSEKRGLSRQGINSFKFTVSAQLSRMSFFLFFFCSNADKTLLNVAYLKPDQRTRRDVSRICNSCSREQLCLYPSLWSTSLHFPPPWWE